MICVWDIIQGYQIIQGYSVIKHQPEKWCDQWIDSVNQWDYPPKLRCDRIATDGEIEADMSWYVLICSDLFKKQNQKKHIKRVASPSGSVSCGGIVGTLHFSAVNVVTGQTSQFLAVFTAENNEQMYKPNIWGSFQTDRYPVRLNMETILPYQETKAFLHWILTVKQDGPNSTPMKSEQTYSRNGSFAPVGSQTGLICLELAQRSCTTASNSCIKLNFSTQVQSLCKAT